MAERSIEEVGDFLRERQQKGSQLINDLNLLREHGDKLLALEKATLIATIITGLGPVDEMADRNLFTGARRPE